MIYYGGLTFHPKNPARFLKIPNTIAAQRIAEAVLWRYGLRQSLNSALESLEVNGEVQPVLSCYQDLMSQRDVGYSDFEASERMNRDSFFFSLLRNASLSPHVEFKITKVSKYSTRW